MRQARAALALLLAFSIPLRAETTTDPLWYLLSTYVLAPDAKAVEAESQGLPDAKGLAALQSDLLLLSEGFESFRDESQVKETLARLEPRMSPELRPFFKDRSSSLDAIYRTLAVTDYTWAQRFPEPPCEPVESRRRLLSGRDGLFQTDKGESSPWLVAVLGPQAKGKSAEKALDQASSRTKLTGSEYERLRARVRRLTLALASEKAVGAARSRLYCSRAAAFEGLASAQRSSEVGPIAAGRSVGPKTEESVFIVVWKDQRAAATLVKTKDGAALVTDAAIVADTDHPDVFTFSDGAMPIARRATVVRRHPQLSLAVLSSDEAALQSALILAENAPSKDDLVTAVGHTMVSGPWTKTSGLVTKVGDVSFQTDASISTDLSGAPVINEAGQLAGILVLRSADTEEGRWPVAIPAPVLARWLDDPAFGSLAVPEKEVIEDSGTAAVLTRARPSALTEAGLGAWNIPGLPPPPPTPHGVCVQNCGDPRSTGPSYSRGSSRSAGTDALGEALGELALAMVFKGIPALFRGIGKLFQGNRGSAGNKTAPRVAPKSVEPPPPPPPKPQCALKQAAAPATAGAEPFEIAVQFSCDDPSVALGGHRVTYTFEWDGKKSTQTAVVVTDAHGRAALAVQVANEETKNHRIYSISERNHDELDNYDPESSDLEESVELFKPPVAEKALMAAVVTTGAPRIVGAGRILTLAGRGATLRVTAVITLGAVGSAVVVVVTAKQVFDIGWAIGSVAERKISEVQWGLKQYEKGEPDCKKASDYQLRKAGIENAHKFKDDHDARPNSRFDICACKDGSIIIKATRTCGMSGPSIGTDRRWYE